jgi:hypothetical protein
LGWKRCSSAHIVLLNNFFAALHFVVERMLQLCSSSSKLFCNMRLCAGIKGCCRCSSSELLCSETYSEHMIRHKNGSIMRYILTYMAAGKDEKKKHHLQVFPK